MKPPEFEQERSTKLKRVSRGAGSLLPSVRNKAVLVEASRKADQSLWSFMILPSLKEAAAIEECDITDLVQHS